MDRDTIANYIQNLSKSKFDNVARLVLTQLFGLEVIDTDRKGDEGFDFVALKASGGSQAIAIQRTIQQLTWKEKALEDAGKAVKRGAMLFYFLTSRLREISELRGLEQSISGKYHIPATCLGGYELADLILQRGLLFEFASVINLPLEIPDRQPPDFAVQALHAYVALSSDRQTLRETVYEDSIIIAIEQLERQENSADRETIINSAQKFLGCPDMRRGALAGRLDSMMGRDIVVSAPPVIRLSASCRKQLAVSNGIYLDEMKDLAGAQSAIMQEQCGIAWSADQSEAAAVVLARWFITEQLSTAERSSMPLARTGLVAITGNPEAELREMLRSGGVIPQRINKAISSFVDVARDTPLMKKLIAAAMYVSLEGIDPATACTALGALNWGEVLTTLDASVAIPYICDCLFGPGTGRFSRGVSECIAVLRKVRAPMRIPWVYLNECAAHLLRALDYEAGKDDFSEDLAHSQNAFVAYYFQLRTSGAAVPDTLKEFLAEFSAAAARSYGDRAAWIQHVMADLQPLFRRYQVDYEDIPQLHKRYLTDVEVEYAYRIKELKQRKSPRLISHDVTVIAHHRRQISERNEIRCMLTWDSAVIGVARQLQNCGWAVTPVDAADLIQPRLRLADRGLCAIAHSLARVQERPAEAAARLIDRIVSMAGEKMADWAFRKRVQQFRDEALARIDLSNPAYANQIEEETDRFLADEGVVLPVPAENESEDATSE